MKLRKHKLNYLKGQIKRMAKEGLFTHFNHKPIMAKEVNKTELPAITYPAKLNPFKSASSKVKLDESENAQLNKFLKKAMLAQNIDELSTVVNEALVSGIRINAYNKNGLSFSNIAVFKMYYDEFERDKEENIISKLALV